jgi:hypothetical protein
MKVVTSLASLIGVSVRPGTLVVDVVGGSDNACGSVTWTFTDAAELHRAATNALRWLAEEIPVDLLGEGDHWVLRPSVVEEDTPPDTDTSASQFLDGKRQGQKDTLGLSFKWPISRNRKQDDV